MLYKYVVTDETGTKFFGVFDHLEHIFSSFSITCGAIGGCFFEENNSVINDKDHKPIAKIFRVEYFNCAGHL